MNEDQILNDLDGRARVAAGDLRARAASRPVPAFDAERAPTVPLAPAPTRAKVHGRPMFAAAAVAVVALLAATLWFGTRDDGDDGVADEVVSGSIQPYLPTELPDGMELAGVGSSDGSGEPDPELAESVGPLTTYGPAVDDPRLAVTVIVDGLSADSSNVPEGRQVPVGDRIGFLREEPGLASMTLEVPATDAGGGPSLIVFGPDVDEDVLVEVARGTTVEGLEATVEPDALPGGWRLLHSDPDGLLGISGPMGMLRGSGLGRSEVAYYLDEGRGRTLVVASAARPSAAVHTQRLFLQDVETVSVRGHQAVGGRFTDAAGSIPEAWSVQWEERPGELVSLTGLGLTRAEVLAAAASLEPVDAQRWEDLVESSALGDLEGSFGDDRPQIELGRGRFADGTAWVLRYSPSRPGDDGGEEAENIALSVAVAGSSESGGSSTFSSVGTAIDEDGNVVEAPVEVFRSTTTIEKGGRAFASGLLRDDVARVEVRAADGTVRADAHLVTAEGLVAWVVELEAGASTLVAFGPDGTELGSHDLPSFEEGRMSYGPDEATPGGEPTTTAGG